jgi:hypothetical protein
LVLVVRVVPVYVKALTVSTIKGIGLSLLYEIVLQYRDLESTYQRWSASTSSPLPQIDNAMFGVHDRPLVAIENSL